MQYPEITSVAVEQAWSKPGSLKPRGGHHLEPQGFKGLFVSGTTGHFIIHRGGGASPPGFGCHTLAALESCSSAHSPVGRGAITWLI